MGIEERGLLGVSDVEADVVNIDELEGVSRRLRGRGGLGGAGWRGRHDGGLQRNLGVARAFAQRSIRGLPGASACVREQAFVRSVGGYCRWDWLYLASSLEPRPDSWV